LQFVLGSVFFCTLAGTTISDLSFFGWVLDSIVTLDGRPRLRLFWFSESFESLPTLPGTRLHGIGKNFPKVIANKGGKTK